MLRIQDQLAILNCRRLPARLNAIQTAALLGFEDHDVPILAAAKLLTALGKPAKNSPKHFSAVEVIALGENREWLDRATRALSSHWKRKNGRRSQAAVQPQATP